MIRNMGWFDRSLRFLAVLLIGILYAGGVVRDELALALGIASIAFLFSGITGFCPLYKIFGVSTCRTPLPKRGKATGKES